MKKKHESRPPEYIKYRGRFYLIVPRLEEPAKIHFLIDWKLGKGTGKTACGKDVWENPGCSGHVDIQKVTCSACRKKAGQPPVEEHEVVAAKGLAKYAQEVEELLKRRKEKYCPTCKRLVIYCRHI